MNSPKTKFPDWAKQTVLTVLCVGSVVAWFALYYLPARIDSQTKDMSTNIGKLQTDMGHAQDDIKRVDGTLNGMLRDMLNAVLNSLKAVKNESPQSAKERLSLVGKFTENAQQAGVYADSGVLKDAAATVLSEVGNPDIGLQAWKTTQALMQYRSFVNQQFLPKLNDLHRSYNFIVPVTSSHRGTLTLPVVMVTGWVESDKAARFEPIGANPPMQHQQIESEYALVDFLGQPSDLDGMWVRNVIIKNAHIQYSGKPLHLENVYFINCKFEVQEQPNVLRFADAFLQTTNGTTFATAG
jgi:hypothetical protein